MQPPQYEAQRIVIKRPAPATHIVMRHVLGIKGDAGWQEPIRKYTSINTDMAKSNKLKDTVKVGMQLCH